ncbi:MAG: sensor histidine kinase, partial [Bdellovibrionales bacterium]
CTISPISTALKQSESKPLHAVCLKTKMIILIANLPGNIRATALLNECTQDLEIYADEVQIDQIVINIINNAIDAYSKTKDAWVKVNAELDSEYIKIIVQDSGHGIEKTTLEKLFVPFFTTKPPGKGTGLGLSIAKGIAKDHGGDLFYEKLDGHTTFILKIPTRRVS